MIQIGNIYNTNNYGPVKILDVNASNRYYLTEFIETGTKKVFRGDQIVAGTIRDPYAASVCGVGCTGDVKTKGKNHRLYSVWHDMINRCYDPKNKRAPAYKNVFVDNRWLIFESFLRDAPNLPGYDEEQLQRGNLTLDKDIKQRGYIYKTYSPETCIWVDKLTNSEIQDSQQRPFVAIAPDGQEYHDYNISRFAREHSLQRRHISGVLHGRCKTTAGWTFYYEDQKNSYEEIV